MKMKIIIEETCTEEFEIDLPKDKDPYDYVVKQYHSGAIVLSPGECQSRKMLLETDENAPENWQEF